MLYLEYETTTKQVVQIHETIPTLVDGYDYAISKDRNESNNQGDIIENDFKLGDEFDKTIWINEVDENKNIIYYSAIRNNPIAKRLLLENTALKQQNEELTFATIDLADTVAVQSAQLQEQSDALLDLSNTLAEVMG